MADPIKIIRALLLASTEVTSLLTQLDDGSYPVFGGVLPEEFNPESNPAITISIRGGSSHSEMPIQDPSIQVRYWCGVNQFLLARQVYEAAYQSLHGISNLDMGDDGKIICLLEEVLGQDITDSEMGWATVMNTFGLKVTAPAFLGNPIVSNNSVVIFGGYL